MPGTAQMSGPVPAAQRRSAAIVLAAVVVVVLAGLAAHRQAQRAFIDEAARSGETTLRLTVASLGAQLQRFERLPPLIAEQAVVRALVEAPDDSGRVAAANLHLRDLARRLGATDVYVIDPAGLTRAASNFELPNTFIGQNYAFRPYFHDAIDGGEGRFFALGIMSGKRGYYFGAPVATGGRIAGVVVVKIDLDAIEGNWRGGDGEIIVTDPEGIVFLSSRADWLFRAIRPLDAAARAVTRETQRYAGTTLGSLDLREAAGPDRRTTVSVGDGGPGQPFLRLAEAMPDAGWEVSVLVPTVSARRQAAIVGLAVALALGLGSMAALVVLQRRARLAERLHLQQAARAELERRVVERTAELAALNTRLGAEVAERITAEADLRQAQAGLVQAGKLAALGQMSAALAHEFNQPLAAARNFADNALTLIDRGRVEEARGNVGRILALIGRMAAISRNLHSFARKPGEALKPVDLGAVVAAAAELAQLRLRAADARLAIEVPPGLPPVVGGPVRLQQVLVNLISNAADAAEGASDRRIHVTAAAVPGGVRVEVRDHGPGVAPALRDRIFDPFFSTKEVGKGLGLGLSISFNIVKDFGGNLSVADAPGGGAAFVLDLPAAAAGSEAA